MPALSIEPFLLSYYLCVRVYIALLCYTLQFYYQDTTWIQIVSFRLVPIDEIKTNQKRKTYYNYIAVGCCKINKITLDPVVLTCPLEQTIWPWIGFVPSLLMLSYVWRKRWSAAIDCLPFFYFPIEKSTDIFIFFSFYCRTFMAEYIPCCAACFTLSLHEMSWLTVVLSSIDKPLHLICLAVRSCLPNTIDWLRRNSLFPFLFYYFVFFYFSLPTPNQSWLVFSREISISFPLFLFWMGF